MSTTKEDIVKAVRELSFDRFFIPGIALKALPGHTLTISTTQFKILRADNSTLYLGDLTTLTTFDMLTTSLIAAGIVISYTPYYNGEESTQQFIPVSAVSMAGDYTAYKKFFFSDQAIYEWMQYYYLSVLAIRIPTDTLLADLDVWVPKLIYPNEQHVALKIAYWLVDKRRMYEYASEHVGLNYTDGSAYSSSTSPSGSTESVTVQIGSVFTLTENPHNGELTEQFNSVGSDNVLGDKYSFWYRLSLYLRSKIEMEFGDYSLRPDQVINSNSEPDRTDLNFRSYYDSYPFRISPLIRGLVYGNQM